MSGEGRWWEIWWRMKNIFHKLSPASVLNPLRCVSLQDFRYCLLFAKHSQHRIRNTHTHKTPNTPFNAGLSLFRNDFTWIVLLLWIDLNLNIFTHFHAYDIWFGSCFLDVYFALNISTSMWFVTFDENRRAFSISPFNNSLNEPNECSGMNTTLIFIEPLSAQCIPLWIERRNHSKYYLNFMAQYKHWTFQALLTHRQSIHTKTIDLWAWSPRPSSVQRA